MHEHSNVAAQHAMYPEDKLNQIIAVAPGVVFQFQVDAKGELSFPYASPRLFEGNGNNSVSAKNAKDVLKLIHPDDLDRVADSIEVSRHKALPWQCDFRVHHENQLKWVRGRANQARGSQGTILWNGMILDITDLKAAQLKLEESERQLRQAQQLASIGHWYAKIEADEVYWSDIVFKIFGLAQEHSYPSVELFRRHVHPEDLPQLLEHEERAKDSGTLDFEHRIIRPNGTIGWVHLIGRLNHLNGTFHGTIQDITERKHAERELREHATTDPLTKLYNRRFFLERSEGTIKLCQRLEKPVTVVMFDLDRFKVVNDTYGHATGDNVLKRIASTVKSMLRAEDVLGRIGGEEFAMTLPDTRLLQGVQVAEKLRQKIEQLEFDAPGKQDVFKLTCSFGVTQRENPQQSLDTLLALADEALYTAKNNGRNRVETKLQTKALR
ncbi:MAG: diguanylate cyclase [Idiomarina sp.]|nr:diguanylate cyclase [Idiomarina sp.]